MEKRRSKRISFDIEAMLVSRSLNYKGVLYDFADDGICVHIHPEENICQLLEGMMFEVKFAPHSGEKIDLLCEVIRTHRQTTNALENIVCMKIIDQPREYREFLKTLR